MNPTSWRLGRVAGIDVFLHPTFLLLLLYVGITREGIGGIVLTSAVFGCVLLHEIGLALTARQFGIATRDITLYPIGGVARLERMPRAPGAELLISLAGPAVNFLIVLALSWARGLGFFDPGGELAILDILMAQLIFINLMLAIFNLLPAFPMDGGRVLRALLSGWIGRSRATMIAAGIGRGLALLLGIYCLIHGEWIQVFLAGFIYLAAGQELASVLAEESRRNVVGRSRPGDPTAEGIWTAPAGFRWISRGNGVWQLAPIVISGNRTNGVSSPWR